MSISLEITHRNYSIFKINEMRKEFKYDFNIHKDNSSICAYNYNGGNTTTHNIGDNTTKFVPPYWEIKIYKFK